MTTVLSLDQGTTSSRAILFDQEGRPAGLAQQEFPQLYPQPGHVEHDPEAIWKSQLETAQKVAAEAQRDGREIAAIGITNQRETIVLWERSTGKPVANAIVWQSRITAPRCEQLKADGYADVIREKTGLVIDAYFSASKIEYLLDHTPGLRARAERGEILCGTIDTFLISRLTGGRVHVTDASNASRTQLLNIKTLDWDDELLKLFRVPREMLPEVRPSSAILGETDTSLFGKSIPIGSAVGDQQAATFGQACFQEGAAKNTYGTGCFMLMNVGQTPRLSRNGLLTTIGWKIGEEVTYCLEGSVFIAGAAIQWLRDGLKIIKSSSEVESLQISVNDTGGVYFVPAFVGLGTPYWDSSARGTIVGITRGTTQAHIVRAAVESMAYQTMDVLETMQQDSGITLQELKVDGGATVNNSLLQFQADLLNVPVQRPKIQETTALGAAYLAGLATGVWKDLKELATHWSLDREFLPKMEQPERERCANDWKRAVERARGWVE
ncbi:glycerol kinase GlpK [Planctomicrobium piriforme]|uniref:Glycerol kinase n=1 Tax=Planctomicrobium piriforme TaxID=1576369 RepID=A0A1I3QI73_9PLAN|nr:glycerol kinase GlpK [Planctomicrobium piriforme]SFJ33219.1 glycerol kinase [Planctomicrobium piriforme]